MKAMIGLPLLCTCALFALASGSAAASTVTVGSPLNAPFTPKGFGTAFTVVNVGLPEADANEFSPITGTVVRWRVYQASGPMLLRVVTPATGGSYTGGRASASETPSDLGVQTFPTRIPIQAGQTVALDVRGGSYVGNDEGSAATLQLWGPPLAVGETRPPDGTFASIEMAFNADVQPPPGLRSVGPQSGPNTGGTTVTVDGHDLTGATEVALGGVPGTHLQVLSDDRVKVRVPRELRSAAVPVSVVTPAGSAELPGAFTYRACVVPRLRGRGITGSAKALRKRGCRLGHIKGNGRSVSHQSRRPGRELFFGARVNVQAR
jgi:hypothetical protein